MEYAVGQQVAPGLVVIHENTLKLLQDQAAAKNDLRQELREQDLQVRELRRALEIALPGMVHTFSGHTYGDGNPTEYVEGCSKCRAMKALTTKVRWKVEVGVFCLEHSKVMADGVCPKCCICPKMRPEDHLHGCPVRE